MPPEYFFPILGIAAGLGFSVLGTVRWYLKARIRATSDASPGLAPGDEARVHALEDRVAELEERLDFTERMLSRAQQEPLGPGGA